MKILIPQVISLLTGLLNGLLGAGGGMIAVPMLQHTLGNTQQAHATSIAMILPLSVVSVLLYLQAGHFTLSQALPYLPGGIAGALVGAKLLKKLNPIWIRRFFGGLVLYSAIRMLWPGN